MTDMNLVTDISKRINKPLPELQSDTGDVGYQVEKGDVLALSLRGCALWRPRASLRQHRCRAQYGGHEHRGNSSHTSSS